MIGLTLDAVSYRYQGSERAAADGVSFDLPLGTVTVIVGANGSGKSTLLGLISGKFRPSMGYVRIGGDEVFSMPPHARAARIAVLPQSERIAFDFSCLDFVLFARVHKRPPFAPPSGKDLSIAAAALESMGVARLAQRPVTELSGGELQLVRLARCLAQESAILVLDEPTAMLDPSHSLAVARAIRSIAASGSAVVLATHDLGFAASIGNRALVLREGRVIAEDEPRRAFDLRVLETAFGVAFETTAVPTPFGFY